VAPDAATVNGTRKDDAMAISTKITPCLWFDTEGEEAAAFYTGLFENSRITDVHRYGPAGPGPEGTVMLVMFELDGQPFTIVNGGPQFPFTEAISLQISCESQEEADSFWNQLTDGGEEGQCGWLKDRYGVSWQVFPVALGGLLGDPDPERSQRAMKAMLGQKRIDLAEIQRAADQA
jgi:predicted 3-demethylubiquinone-9 3-methyltransferase (glyoxalase superfamily)